MLKAVIKFAIVVCLIGFIVAFISAILVSYHQIGYHSEPGLTTACINNLRQIDAAANQFALENHLTNGDRINFPSDLTPYIKLDSKGNIPSCPMGGAYHLGRVGKAPTCSLSTTVTPAHVLQ
jgi:hypothetical protein